MTTIGARGRAWRRYVAVAAVATAVSASAMLAPAQAEMLGGLSGGRASLPQQMALRQQLHLSTNPVTVALLNANSASPVRYGMAVSEAEAATLDSKAVLTSYTDAAVAAAMSGTPAGDYDGMFLDPAAAGGAVFRTAGDPDAMSAAVAPAMHGMPFRVVRATVPLATLDSVHDAVVADWDELSASGVRLASVGVDLPGERVVVQADGITAGDLQAAYGAPFRVDPYVDFTTTAAAGDGPPRKAGHQLLVGGLICTAAFEIIYYPGNLNNAPSVGTLTAGHCGDTGTPVAMQATNGFAAAIGTYNGDTFDGTLTDTSDAAVVRDLPTPLVLASNRLIDNIYGERRVTSLAAWGSGFDAVGATVCKYGIKSQDTCGLVQDTNLSIRLGPNGKLFDNFRKASVYSCFGDSGGPVYGRNSGLTGQATAVGIQSGILYPSGTPAGDESNNDPRCVNQTASFYSHARDAIRDVGTQDGSRVYYLRTANTG